MSSLNINLAKMLIQLPPELRDLILLKAMSFGAMTWEDRYTVQHKGELISFTTPRHYSFYNLATQLALNVCDTFNYELNCEGLL